MLNILLGSLIIAVVSLNIIAAVAWFISGEMRYRMAVFWTFFVCLVLIAIVASFYFGWMLIDSGLHPAKATPEAIEGR